MLATVWFGDKNWSVQVHWSNAHSNMRIFSNTLLTWPEVLHIFQGARHNIGQWQTYSFYRIQQLEPLILNTTAPLNLLEMSRQFDCYERFELNTRVGKLITIQKKTLSTRVYIPALATVNDVIVIRQD